MKNSSTSLLVTFATAVVATVGVLASGNALDGAVVLSILFAAGVAGWTSAQYRQAPAELAVERPVRLTVVRKCPECPALPLAA